MPVGVLADSSSGFTINANFQRSAFQQLSEFEDFRIMPLAAARTKFRSSNGRHTVGSQPLQDNGHWK